MNTLADRHATESGTLIKKHFVGFSLWFNVALHLCISNLL